MNGQTNLHFGQPQPQPLPPPQPSSASSQQQQMSVNRNIRSSNSQQGGSSASSIASVAAQLHHNHQQQQLQQSQQQQSQQQQYLLQQQQNYLDNFSPPQQPQQELPSPQSSSTSSSTSSSQQSSNLYRSTNANNNNPQIYAHKDVNTSGDLNKVVSPIVPTHQQHQDQQQQIMIQQQEIFLKMRQQYESQIHALQMEICSMKSQSIGGSTMSTKASSGGKSGNRNNGNNNHHIVDTYCEQLQLSKDFQCRNCVYKTKSEASLVIHNTNHLVSQRYLHLPTTVFSVNNREQQPGANPFLYPCGECSGKYSHNDLYLHIYEHHTGEHPFHCDECDLYFMHFEFLDDHQRGSHMKHPSKAKKSRYDHHNNNNSSLATNHQPQLTYYSVIKCSKPFSVLAGGNAIPSGTSVRAPGSPWNNHNQDVVHNNLNSRSNNNMMIQQQNQGFKPNSPLPPHFPSYGSGTGKRGRGRGSSGSSSAASNHNSGHQINRSSQPPPLPPMSSPSTSSSSPLTTTTTLLSPTQPPPSGHHHNPNNGIDSGLEFKCHFEECFFVSDTKDRLDFHLFAHQNSRFKCPHCPYVSNVLNDIKRHCIKGAKHERAMFICPSCEFPTNCDKTFRDHIRTIHFGKNIDDKALTNYIEGLFQNVSPVPVVPPSTPQQKSS